MAVMVPIRKRTYSPLKQKVTGVAVVVRYSLFSGDVTFWGEKIDLQHI